MKSIKYIAYAITIMAASALTASCDDEPNDDSRSSIELEPAEWEHNQSLNAFSTKLVTKVASMSDGGNILISPLGLNMVLGMIGNGVQGDAYDNFCSAFGISDINALNSLNDKIMNTFMTADNQCEVMLANSVWSVKPIVSDYTSLVEKIYSANTFEVERLSKSEIDKWGDRATKGKLTDVAEPDISKYPSALYNLLYFNGKWEHPFDPENTKKADFTTIDNEKHQVDMMEGKFDDFSVLQNDFMRMAYMDFGNKDHFTMCAMLPNKGVDVCEALESLPGDWTTESTLEPDLPKKIAMPKFNLDMKVIWDDLLKSCGLSGIFETCDFSPMFGTPAKISGIYQKINFEINEAGAKAKVVTGVNMDWFDITEKYQGPDFIFDRPFAFFIIERDTKAILLAGVINRL